MQTKLAELAATADPLSADIDLSRFDLVKKLVIEERDGDDYQYDLYLDIGGYDHAGRIALVFENVSKLVLGRDQWRPQIVGLKIRRLGDRQWDRLNWEVIDGNDGYGNGEAVIFYCRTAKIVSLVGDHRPVVIAAR